MGVMKRIYFIKKNLSEKKSIRSSGFTLAELLMATFILIPIYLMTMLGFINGLRINEISRNTALALSSSLNIIDSIENTPFDQIYGTYHNTTFTVTNLNGIGITQVDSSQPDYLTVSTTFCWREPNGRLMGEDQNLNGQLEQNEDTNNNGEMDSPVKLVTVIYDV